MTATHLKLFPQASDLEIDLAQTQKPKPDLTGLAFGTVFTDHMLVVEWNSQVGWQRPRIQPFGNLSIHPACSALHYAVQVRPSLPDTRCVSKEHISFNSVVR